MSPLFPLHTGLKIKFLSLYFVKIRFPQNMWNFCDLQFYKLWELQFSTKYVETVKINLRTKNVFLPQCVFTHCFCLKKTQLLWRLDVLGVFGNCIWIHMVEHGHWTTNLINSGIKKAHHCFLIMNTSDQMYPKWQAVFCLHFSQHFCG